MIHMFNRKVKIRRSSDNMVNMREREDERLLKLKGTSTWAHNYAHLSHHDEGTLSSTLDSLVAC